MELLTPQLGLFFWTLVIFLVFFFLLRRFAWKPILSAIHSREESIAGALAQAEKAREELSLLTHRNEEELRQVRQERSRILQEAEEMKRTLLTEAQTRAREEAAKRIATAEQEIEAAKQAALQELKATAGELAVRVAEQLLRRELANPEEQRRLVDSLISELNVTSNR